jgi:hypothetical protein
MREPFDKYVRQKLYNHSTKVPKGLWEDIAAQNLKPEIPIYQTVGFKFLIFSAFTSFFVLLWILVDKPIENKVTKQGLLNNKQLPSAVIGNILAKKIFEQNNTNKFSDIKAWYEETNNIADNAFTSNKVLNKTQDSLASLISVPTLKQVQETEAYEFYADYQNNLLTYPSFLSEVLQKSKTANTSYVDAIQQMNAATIVSKSKNISANNNWQTVLSPSQFQRFSTPVAKTSTLYLELFASANYDMQSIFNYGVTEAYLQRKDSAETMQTGFSAGFRIGKYITNNLMIKGGLQYTQVNKLFALRSEKERTTTPVIVNRTINNPDGTTSIVPDTSYVTQISYNVTKANNRYRSIEIPLLLSYEFGKSKWHFAVNGGAIVRASSWSVGTTFDTNNNLVLLEDKNRTYYHKQTHLSAVGSVSVLRYLNNNTAVFAEPYFRYTLTNGETTVLGFSEKFHSTGIILGMRIKLNNRN